MVPEKVNWVRVHPIREAEARERFDAVTWVVDETCPIDRIEVVPFVALHSVDMVVGFVDPKDSLH